MKHCPMKGKYDNEVVFACSVNALFFIHYAGTKNVIHNTLYLNKSKGKGLCKTKFFVEHMSQLCELGSILRVRGFFPLKNAPVLQYRR